MTVRPYKHNRLMEESEARVELAAYLQAPADLAARRILNDRGLYHRWEAEHDRLMQAVSGQSRIPNQVIALRTAAFNLVHRRALFEYLRERQVTGSKRHRLFALFYGCRDYANAVLAEHGSYVCWSSSYVCTHHIASHLMGDAAFEEPLQLYEQWYGEYFHAYCDVELAATRAEQESLAPLAALRPLLKHRLADARQAILLMPQSPTCDWREVQIRKPNGDTQRMRAIFGAH